MFDYIIRKERLAEAEARHFFRQLVQAVSFIHSEGSALLRDHHYIYSIIKVLPTAI